MQVTTVIPVYNGAEYVSAAIDSALMQRGIKQQVIVVDDGSTDETPRRLEAFKNHIQVIRQPNRGLSAARNVGIQAAEGELVAFLDADDVWCQDKLARQVAALRDAPEASMVHSRTVSWDAGSGGESEFVKAPSQDYRGDCFAKLYQANAICVSSVMVKTTWLRKLGGFDEQILRPTTQDYDLWLRIASRSQLQFVEEKGTLYRRHLHNASKQTLMMLEDHIYVIQKALSYGYERLCRELGRRKALLRLANLYFELGYFHYGQGNIRSAKTCFQSSLRYGHLDSRNVLFAFLPDMFLAWAARRHQSR
jgi:glycosyltransferase involved in cell wall biosynthesis